LGLRVDGAADVRNSLASEEHEALLELACSSDLTARVRHHILVRMVRYARSVIKEACHYFTSQRAAAQRPSKNELFYLSERLTTAISSSILRR
jgi:hypothetical protein